MNTLFKIAALIILTFTNVLGNNKPLEGTTMQVIAPSGLNLRYSPSVDSPVITVMPYGATVILKEFEDPQLVERVEWVDGNWIKVDFRGQIGWTFDGFLTVFDAPEHNLTTVYEDLDFLYPVEFWARGQFFASKIDTVEQLGYSVSRTHEFTNHATLNVKEFDSYAELELIIYDTRVMELYQILLSMVHSNEGKDIIKESTIFIEKDGSINHVKINTEHPVSIKKIGDNKIQMKVRSNYLGC